MEKLLDLYMSRKFYHYGEIWGIASTTFCMYNNRLEWFAGAMGGCWEEAYYY